MGPVFMPLSKIGLKLRFPFLTGCAGGSALGDFAEAAAAIQIVEIFTLGIDEFAKRTLGRFASAEHRFGMIVGRLAQHVILARALAGSDQLIAPIENFVAVGHATDGHGAVNVLACFHGLDALGGMKPRLGDHDDGVPNRSCTYRQA